MQSGIAYFIVRQNGERVAMVPEKPTNPHGRPLAQGLMYSDTPELPLKRFYFDLPPVDAKQQRRFTVTAVNTTGLESEPSESLLLKAAG